MPANRSRTERWRISLEKIRERGGGIELTMARGGAPDPAWPDQTPPDLLWRVRLLDVGDRSLVVECPNAAGQTIELAQDLKLVGVLAVGQNRWMFSTRVLGSCRLDRYAGVAIRLAMPEDVERCQRRNFFRTSTAEITVPTVGCWHVLNPQSIVSAEIASRALISDLRDRGQILRDTAEHPFTLPEVGPRFSAHLMNLGGGGVGLVVPREDRASVEELRLYWLGIDLRPHIPAPLGVTGKIVHTHIDSEVNTYCGVAFEFGFNPSHKRFVTDQILRYAALVQGSQLSALRRAG